VGRVAFKRRVTPLKGNHVFVLPLCIASFHLPSPRMGDTRSLPALSSKKRNFAEVGTFQPSFGFKDFHQVARPHPSPVVTQDGDHQRLGGEKQAGLRSWSRPQLQGSSSSWLGGGRAEPGLYLPRGFVGHLLPQHSRERALTGLAGGSDFDNAGLVGGERRQLQRVGLAGSAGSGLAPGAPSRRESDCRAARTGGPPETSRAARAAFVFWGCPAFAPVRRLCVEVSAPLVREDPSGDLLVGRWLPSSALRWWQLKKSPTGSLPPSALRASGSLALIACSRPSSGDVGEGIVATASALRLSPLQFGHLERRSLSLLPE
jgi:hypothetical protein